MINKNGNIIVKILLLVKLFFLSQHSLAQVVYYDVKPDVVIEDVSRYNIDLNKDGQIDYKLIHDTNFANWPVDWSQIAVIDHFMINELIGTLDGHFHPKALIYNAYIYDGAKIWANHEANLVLNVQTFYDGYLHKVGYWQLNNLDAFLGVRFMIQEAWHYGWIRLNVSRDATKIILKDYAYNSLPDQDVFAGEGIPLANIDNVEISDVADNGNGSDIQVTFNYPENEFIILEYRIIVVKASDAVNFRIDDANQVILENYTKKYAMKMNLLVTLDAGMTDKDGEPIIPDVEYKVFVLCVKRGERTKGNNLSPPSNSITLNAPVGIKDYVDKADVLVYISGNTIFVKTASSINSSGRVSVYNSIGKQIFEEELKNNQISLQGYDSGIYFVTVSLNNELHKFKLFVEK